MTDTGLLSAFQHLHPNKEPPVTYTRGTKCVDVALVCPLLLPGVTRVGYAPFYYSGNYDHRELIHLTLMKSSYLNSLPTPLGSFEYHYQCKMYVQ